MKYNPSFREQGQEWVSLLVGLRPRPGLGMATVCAVLGVEEDLRVCHRVPEECTEEVRELIDVCMRTNVNERPSAMDLVNRLQVIQVSSLSHFQACTTHTGYACLVLSRAFSACRMAAHLPLLILSQCTEFSRCDRGARLERLLMSTHYLRVKLACLQA